LDETLDDFNDLDYLSETDKINDSPFKMISPWKSLPTQFYHNLGISSSDKANASEASKIVSNTSNERTLDGEEHSNTISAPTSTISSDGKQLSPSIRWISAPSESLASLSAAASAKKDSYNKTEGRKKKRRGHRSMSSLSSLGVQMEISIEEGKSDKRMQVEANENHYIDHTVTSKEAPGQISARLQLERMGLSAQHTHCTCDICRDATFEDYGDAVTHEKNCVTEKRARVDPSLLNKEEEEGGPEASTQRDNNPLVEEPEEPLSKPKLLESKRLSTTMAQKETVSTTLDPYPTSNNEQLGSWTCDVCMQAEFEDYENAVAHERICVGTNNTQARLSHSNKAEEKATSPQQDEQDQFLTQEKAREEVLQWLSSHLPRLQKEDAEKYCTGLMEDGFDSLDVLAGVSEEDLTFMKKAHKRTLLNRMREGSNKNVEQD